MEIRPNWFTKEAYKGPGITQHDMAWHGEALSQIVSGSLYYSPEHTQNHWEMVNRFRRTFGEKL